MCFKKLFCPDPPDIEELKKQIEQRDKTIESLKEIATPLLFPPPPSGGIEVDANYIYSLINPYGIQLSGGSSDWKYMLMKEADARRFVAWYHDNCPFKPQHYTSDTRDCEDFAWTCRDWALLWMESIYFWGYIEAESTDPFYPFKNHGFNYLATDNGKVWYYDRLGVAAYDNDIFEAYPVKCNASKA